MKLLSILLCLAALLLCLFAEEQLVRVAHHEPVLGFQLNEMKDQITFTAYGKLWLFSVWNTQVTTDYEDFGYHYHGRLSGEVRSTAASFTIAPEFISGMIILCNDTYWIESLDPTHPTELFMYRSSDVWVHPSITHVKCGSTPHHNLQQQRQQQIDSDLIKDHEKRRVFSSYILADQYWVSSTSNPSWYTRDATVSLLNDVNAVYDSAGLSHWSFTVKKNGKYVVQNQWTTMAQVDNMLNYISQYSETRYSPNYDNVAWLVGNNVGGKAWIASACGQFGNYYKTAVVGLTSFSRLFTVKNIAHELGHNRGANHDFVHQCADGQSTDCQCSVMSYCFPTDQTYGGAVNYFSNTSKNEIRNTCN